jgi:hypothetical protein
MKTHTQLDRDIDEAIGDSFTVHNGQYRVHVAPDRYRGGYSAKLISVNIGTIMEPNGRTARQALATLLKDLRREGSYELAREISAKGWSPGR